MSPRPPHPPGNILLRELAPAARKELDRHLKPLSFGKGFIFYEHGQEMRHVYFVEHGLVSFTTVLSDGFGVENAAVGREGVLGITSDMRPAPSFGVVMGQIEGAALQIDKPRLREFVEGGNPAFKHRLSLFTEQLMGEMRQSAACLARHEVDARMSRWLLRCQDRIGGEEIPLTQDFMGHMLGVQRSTVSEVASALERDGLITYTRGRITILDRAGLERRACECYPTLRARETDGGVDPAG